MDSNLYRLLQLAVDQARVIVSHEEQLNWDRGWDITPLDDHLQAIADTAGVSLADVQEIARQQQEDEYRESRLQYAERVVPMWLTWNRGLRVWPEGTWRAERIGSELAIIGPDGQGSEVAQLVGIIAGIQLRRIIRPVPLIGTDYPATWYILG
jgi:hypothetical protein